MPGTDQVFRDIVESADHGVVVHDSGGRIVYANGQMAAMLGYPPAELIGRFVQDLVDNGRAVGPVPPDHSDLVDLHDGGVADCCFCRKDGATCWAIVAVHAFPGDGRGTGCVLIVTDASRFTIRSGPIAIDLASLRVEEHGKAVPLTLKELLLLRYLIQHRGRILTRGQILADVWGGPHCGERTVDVHVSHLRRKLPSVAKHIVSVERTGYLLKPASPTRRTA